jgi:hypothetical protein
MGSGSTFAFIKAQNKCANTIHVITLHLLAILNTENEGIQYEGNNHIHENLQKMTDGDNNDA